MRVGVLGINHKLADVKLREALAKACQNRFLQHVHESHTFVLLSTCNRTEVYFASEDLAAAHSYLLNTLRCHVESEFEQKLYTYFERDCFWHVCRVVSGLDSAIVAETEIQGQVKAAYEQACRALTLPSSLHFLFQKALKVGKGVRTELSLGRGVPDLEHAVFSLGVRIFETLNATKVLFVGASAINLKIARYLQVKGLKELTLCNRSYQRGKEAAYKHHLHFLPWGKLEEWHTFDWVVFGTKSPDYLIDSSPLSTCKLIVDLCVPRNVDPILGHNPHIALYDIDQLNKTLRMRKLRLQHHLFKAEEYIANAAKKQIALFREKERSRHKALPLSA